MCGIAGIIGRIDERNRAALARMNDSMAHRGPDGQGTWESVPDARGSGCLLAHRRLAIIDLSSAGAQPMVDPVTGQVIVFNGEIYNFQELRERLAAAGHKFESSGDTAVMLRALGLHGREAVRQLRGMFAFAAWDPEKRKLLLARDPLGIKPLYLARNPDRRGSWSVAFASEVRALLASGLLGTPRLSSSAAASVVWNGFIVGPQTAVRGVESLLPGQLLVFGDDGREEVSEEHWSIPRSASSDRMDEESLSAVLEETLRLHLISDVPLAVFLSSGVDSSSVANLAQRAACTPVHTFTLAFEDEQLNEGHAARRIAASIGTQHQEVLLTEQEFVEGLDAALDSLDQPTFDGLNSYYMSRAIRKAGFTVALVGTGGDELFGGYPSFRELPVVRRWAGRLRWLPKKLLIEAARTTAAALQPGSGDIPPQTRWAKLPHMVRRGEDLLALYQLAYAIFLPDFQRELLGGSLDSLLDGLHPVVHARLLRETASRSTLSAISVMEQRLFLGERLLRDNDAASMAASIEQRLPLVDRVLFSALDQVGDETRYTPVGRKSLLRRIGLRGLDPKLFERPKAGFVLPFDRWIRKGLFKAMDRTLRDPMAVQAAGLAPEPVSRLWHSFQAGCPGIYWSRVWALFVLVRWCQRHGIQR
jgi:asparagine synthase (glutamine-hydrolysing)